MSAITPEEIKELLHTETNAVATMVGSKLDAQTDAMRTMVETRLDAQTRAVLGMLKEELTPIHDRLDRHTAILESHTVTLDAVAKSTENTRIELAATRAALARHEGWFEQLAKKFGIRFS